MAKTHNHLNRPNPRHLFVMALVLCVLGALIWGGLQWRHARYCSGLEEDFLNAFDSEVRASQLASFHDEGIRKAASSIREVAQSASKKAIEGLARDCGSRAADTAIRKASEAAL